MRAYGVRVAVLVAVLGGVGLAGEVSAQEVPPAGTMGIWFPDPADVGQGEFTLEDFLGGSIAVFAGGVLCGAFEVVEPTLIVVGAAEQPGACRVDGASIEFANGHGHMTSVTTRFEAGATVSFDNFAPWVPHMEYPAYACDYFDSTGIETVNCQMIGPPGAAPGAVGNAGLAHSSGDAAPAWQVAGLLVLTLILVASGRRASRRFES